MSMLTLKGPHWVTVRQHRLALWALAAAVAASLAAVVALRWQAAGASAPTGTDPLRDLREPMGYGGLAALLLPLLAGAFVAGPMVARELESGTYRLALTQSSTPKSWLASKVVAAAVAAVASAAAFGQIHQFGRLPLSAMDHYSWSEPGPYATLGTVLPAYCLLGVAVGALVGQLVRRTVAAMAVTGLVTGLVMAVLGALRWSFLSTRTVTSPLGIPFPHPPRDAFTTDFGFITSSGGRLPEWACPRSSSHDLCPAELDVTRQYVDYHPYAHYWPTQSVETGIVLVLAALALWGAFAVLRKRHP
ncbi:ABC transporter permease [Streptomyces yangpuensis]|uniref:ABC transporter permease n=1 Tax=Streptomyces yangpuensis TaxID=1648182 RepID=A0ABY5PUI5_9ACTN|nr:ABC transporter permease [Streptomyces yangpuensis]UUY47686.1 ABC transporter permease [Streptomyces yangpuensis]